MKKHILKLIPIAALLLGLALILYPSISNYINSIHQSKAIQSYNDIASDLNDEKRSAIFAAAQNYNKLLADTPDSFFHPEQVPGYFNSLDITGTGIMGYLTINKINVELPIYHSVDENVLQIAVGHLQGSSLPVGGIGSHCVLSGHRGLPSAKLFSDLDKLEPGDTFTITILSDLLTYQVDKISVVLPYEVDDLQIDPDSDLCTLFTCTPYGINTHRLLVRGHRIANDAEAPTIYVPNEAFRITPLIVTPVVAAPMLIVLFFAMLISVHNQKKKRK